MEKILGFIGNDSEKMIRNWVLSMDDTPMTVDIVDLLVQRYNIRNPIGRAGEDWGFDEPGF